ncbi:MAG: glycerol-3-phosphate acyltransferase, partial [Novosphingobium sp.]
MNLTTLLPSMIAGYLLGSIPFGLILTRLTGAGDLRAIGSGSIGATNVLRTGRKGLAAATLLLDLGKGACAVWLAGNLPGGDDALGGFAAVIGHCFPVWLKFKGGKGVATAAGVILALSPITLLAALLVFLAAVTATR